MPFIFTKKLAVCAPLEAFVLERELPLRNVLKLYVCSLSGRLCTTRRASRTKVHILYRCNLYSMWHVSPLKLTPTYLEWAGRENPEVKNRPSR